MRKLFFGRPYMDSATSVSDSVVNLLMTRRLHYATT